MCMGWTKPDCIAQDSVYTKSLTWDKRDLRARSITWLRSLTLSQTLSWPLGHCSRGHHIKTGLWPAPQSSSGSEWKGLVDLGPQLHPSSTDEHFSSQTSRKKCLAWIKWNGLFSKSQSIAQNLFPSKIQNFLFSPFFFAYVFRKFINLCIYLFIYLLTYSVWSLTKICFSQFICL